MSDTEPRPEIDALLVSASEREAAHVAMLREFAGVGMDLARGIRDRVITVADPALSYSRIGATLHKTLQLEDRIAHTHLKRVEARDRSRKFRAKGLTILKQHDKAKVREALERSAENDIDPADIEPVMADIKQRIEDPDIQDLLGLRPVPDIVEDLYGELLTKWTRALGGDGGLTVDPAAPDSG
jgi:hypothetical protein